MTRKAIVIVLHGPAGVGKDSVIAALQERLGIHRAISSTTRPPREGEVDGEHYHFLDETTFTRKATAGEFIEHARVYDQGKGLEAGEILPYIERGEDVIIRTDVQGARTWRATLDGAVSILLVAEDRDALRGRLVNRGTEGGEELRSRLAEVEAELADAENNDYVVVNRHGQIEVAVAEIERIIAAERANPDRPTPSLRAAALH